MPIIMASQHFTSLNGLKQHEFDNQTTLNQRRSYPWHNMQIGALQWRYIVLKLFCRQFIIV